MDKKDGKSNVQLPHFVPVVAVLGHVDHGKTTLLDTIRKTSIAAKEHGGITQKIGASSVEIIYNGEKRKITFIDTPGHEAFFRMRGRGAQAADIGLLVVSLTDGVMPQTKESIKLLELSKIPFIVVLTKSDIPDKNPKKVKQQLVKEGIMLEGYGGEVPVMEVSARANFNIKELLELVLLVSEVKFENVSKDKKLKAIVIESRLDQKSGPRATLVVKSGSINVGDEISYEEIDTKLQTKHLISKIRTIINDKREHLKKAEVGDAVEVLGFEKVPNVGSVVQDAGSSFAEAASSAEVATKAESEDKPVANSTLVAAATPEQLSSTNEQARADLFVKEEKPALSVMIVADTLGSLDAIINLLPKEVLVISQKTGEISPSDILFAKSVDAIILGFNIKIKPNISKFASQEKVMFKNYNLIYELVDEISEVLKGKKLDAQEEVFGVARVLASFPFEKTKVLGISVLEGRVARGDRVRLMRGEEAIGESHITSVKEGKNVTSKVEKGHEAGIIIVPFLDFTIGDVLICHG